MPQQQAVTVDNQFIEGLKTEFTGLNFPDKACIDTINLVFDKTGKVSRRLGLDYEDNYALEEIDRGQVAVSTYLWKYATGGTVISSFVVLQVGTTIHFYDQTVATTAAPISTQKIASTIDLNDFIAQEVSVINDDVECTYTDGEGKLFIFHPNINPIVCTYDGTDITGAEIIVKIRDHEGIVEEGVADDKRPSALTDVHKYNLANQGWGRADIGTSETSFEIPAPDSLPADATFTTQEGLPIEVGDRVRIYSAEEVFASIKGDLTTNYVVGPVISYTGTSLQITITEVAGDGNTFEDWVISFEPPYIEIWYDALGSFPSNSDVWWYYKDVNDEFNPEETIDNIGRATGPAPKGHYILEAFYQDRAEVSGIDSLEIVSTVGVRPHAGAWFAGRIWYAGPIAPGFTETIYYSQIIENSTQYGKCYQVNDPSSAERFDLLSSDGGYVKIQGAGRIHKLFPMGNGMLVFADRGIWFITGSQGIGFTANDHTITKISEVYTLSQQSFVNVQGSPMWWTEEGIYTVQFGEGGKIGVQSLSDDTISTYFQEIPLQSRRYARGFYNPSEFTVQWVFRSVLESSITSRYQYTHILNFNIKTKAFYPWHIHNSFVTQVNGVLALGGEGGETSPPLVFKYLTSTVDGSTYQFTFSETWNEDYLDWLETESPGTDAEAYVTTGYRISGKGILKGQIPFVEVHCSTSEGDTSCYIQALWDWASNGSSGHWSSTQILNFDKTFRDYQSKRVRLRGRGKAVQIKFTSLPGARMDLIGWTTLISNNTVP